LWDEKGSDKNMKARKNWVNGEIIHINSLHGKMDLEFAKNMKKQGISSLFKTL
jgi:hypothetical protein